MKLGKKIVLTVAAVLVLAVCSLLFVFRGEIKTVLSLDIDGTNGVYAVDYSADYKLDELLAQGGAENEEQLAQYIIKVMLKGLPVNINYEVPQLACSTFLAGTPEGGFVFGRNLDNQETDLAVVKTHPKGCYSSVSVVNLSFLGYNSENTPKAIKNRIVMLAVPYFPLDGVNEKGLAVGVLQLQAPATQQNTAKPDVDTTFAIRILLDRAATVSEAIELLEGLDMHASANGCYHLHIADALGNSAVVSYVNNEMRVTEKQGSFQACTNFYLHDVPFEYEKQGLERYETLTETLGEKEGVLTLQEGMGLLNAVSIVGTDPDEEGRVYSTQWSSVYNLTNPSLMLCTDRKYDAVKTYTVD